MNKQIILEAAVSLAKTRGYANVYKRHIADVLGCATGTVNYHWGKMPDLRLAIVQTAVKENITPILLQAIAANHHAIRHLSTAQRSKILASA